MAQILIIEDDQLVRDSLQEFLLYEGFETLTVADGRSVGQLVKEYCPDLILSVIDMPEKNRYEILAELRQDPLTASIPYIFLTTRTTGEGWRKGIQSKTDAHLMNLCNIDELLATIHRLSRQDASKNGNGQKILYKNPKEGA